LGSTRFFKVARAYRPRHKGALVVVKVFVLHDPTLPLVEHKEKLEFLNRELSPKNNCLPFAKPVVYPILIKQKGRKGGVKKVVGMPGLVHEVTCLLVPEKRVEKGFIPLGWALTLFQV
jgi:hypothetical protein